MDRRLKDHVRLYDKSVFDPEAELEVTGYAIDIPEESPFLRRNRNCALLPRHFERYYPIFQEYEAGTRRSSGNTLGDKLTRVGFEEKPFRFSTPKKKPTSAVVSQPFGTSVVRIPVSSKIISITPPIKEQATDVLTPKEVIMEFDRRYTATEIAGKFGIGYRQVAQWRRYGHIPASAIAGDGPYCYKADAIDKLIADGKLPPKITSRTLQPSQDKESKQEVISEKEAEKISDTSSEKENVFTDYDEFVKNIFEMIRALRKVAAMSSLSLAFVDFSRSCQTDDFRIERFKFEK